MTERLPAGMDEAFLTAAAELGMCNAARLFVREAEAEGRDCLLSLRDALGRSFPVLDAVAGARLEPTGAPPPAPGLAAALRGIKRVVVVGIEAAELDLLVSLRGDRKLALLTESPLATDWERVLANFGGAVEAVDLSSFQRFAGQQSALLTFAYGVSGDSAHVAPVWLRVAGDDVRTQFGALIAWDVLGAPMFVYPRWLVEVATSSFTHVLA